MSPIPNEVYTLFSFFGFVLCVIPLYWHLEARNAGTCLYMIWTGLGCLLQCINSIVWNKNMINRSPFYCDISTHLQIAFNVALPASSLCINHQLYKAARMKTAGVTDAEKRRNLICDLLIGVGIPVLQVIAEYVVSDHRYDILEDFGPVFSAWRTPLTFVLFHAWPVAIGTVSFFYCAMAIYTFYWRRRNHMKLISSANRDRYLRLMIISSIEILGTVPLGTYYIVSEAKMGVVPWMGWARMHSHASDVEQVPGFIWKNDPAESRGVELFRWSLVLCAFLFFALFGLTGEAREHYYRLYKSLAKLVGRSTSTAHGAQLTTPPVPYMKRNGDGTNPITVQMGRKDSLSIISISLADSDQSSTMSISMGSTLNQNSMTLKLKDSDSDTMSFYTAKSFYEPVMEHECQLPPPRGLPPTARPVSVPSVPPPVFLPTFRPTSMPLVPPPGIPPTLHPTSFVSHFPDPTKSTMPVHASSNVETV